MILLLSKKKIPVGEPLNSLLSLEDLEHPLVVQYIDEQKFSSTDQHTVSCTTIINFSKLITVFFEINFEFVEKSL